MNRNFFTSRNWIILTTASVLVLSCNLVNLIRGEGSQVNIEVTPVEAVIEVTEVGEGIEEVYGQIKFVAESFGQGV